MATGDGYLIQASSFLIDGFALEEFGFCREINDTYGFQTVIAPYALLLRGLCYRVDEQWAPGYTAVIVAWTGVSLPSTTWTGITLPTTTWTPS